jgi:hypothetical protein
MLELWDRLPPNLRGTLRTLVTIALNGGCAALGAVVIDPDHFGLEHLKHVGIVFGVGALAAVVNWLRQSPWKTADDRLMTTIARSAPVLMIAGLLGLAACTMPGCASAPPAGTYSTVGLKAFNADALLKDVTALSETAINLNATSGPLHLKDRDTAIVRDFALSAGAGLVAYADGKGSLAVVVAAFDELTRKLSAEASLNDKLRFILALVADNIHRIPQ